jgi:DNA-binding PadR family transcriptional regulator
MVARLLHEEPRPLQQVADIVAAGSWRTAYNAVCRLRERGLAELHRTGSRTPVWRLTDQGREWLTDNTAAVMPPQESVPPAPEGGPIAQAAGFSTVY